MAWADNMRLLHLTSATCLVLSIVGASAGQEPPRDRSPDQVLRRLEDEVFAEINRVRSDPSGYAERFIAPLQPRLVRIPKNEAEPFREFRAFLPGGGEVDYLTLDEGGSEETARPILDEAIAALRAAPKLTVLRRNDVLDRSARFYSRDFLTGGPQRDPHVDSLGRKPGERIGSFGSSRESLAGWQRFVGQIPDGETAVARVFQQNDRFYWLAFSEKNAYRYWSVPQQLGEFVIRHGEQKTLGRLEKAGYECVVTIDRKSRMLRHGDARVPYPFLLPTHGENVTWGNWSPAMAARGMVLWWLLDPGIQNRGHRKMLLDPDYQFGGVGCARSPSLGWVCTLDACGAELFEFPEGG